MTMNIYTYYGETQHAQGQLELIEVWKKNWKSKGWNPRVIYKEDAKKASIHDEYVDFVFRVHGRINKNNTFKDNTYAMEAQRELAAFTLIDEPSYISDYDVFNLNLSPNSSVEQKVHWRDGLCTCFASGGASGWTEYIKWIFSSEDRILKGCKEEYAKSGRDCFHDQDFLVFAMKEIHDSHSPNVPVFMDGVPFYEYRNNQSPVSYEIKTNDSLTTHISHRACSVINKYNDLKPWDKRIALAREIL